VQHKKEKGGMRDERTRDEIMRDKKTRGEKGEMRAAWAQKEDETSGAKRVGERQ
jgi:hypothetical protein